MGSTNSQQHKLSTRPAHAARHQSAKPMAHPLFLHQHAHCQRPRAPQRDDDAEKPLLQPYEAALRSLQGGKVPHHPASVSSQLTNVS